MECQEFKPSLCLLQALRQSHSYAKACPRAPFRTATPSHYTLQVLRQYTQLCKEAKAHGIADAAAILTRLTDAQVLVVGAIRYPPRGSEAHHVAQHKPSVQ